MSLLGFDTLREVHAAALAADVCAHRTALFAGIHSDFFATIPTASGDAAQLLLDLETLDRTQTLADGTLPIARWLANALVLAGGRKEVRVFQMALERCPNPSSPKTAGGREQSNTTRPKSYQDKLLLLPRRQDFVGRTTDLQAVMASLNHPRSWLTSIEGIPGIGKTSLAIEAAHRVLENGCFEAMVYLTAKSYDLLLADIVDAVTRTVGQPESNETKQDVSIAYELLSAKRTLLIIDNFDTLSRDHSAICEFLRDLPAPSKALVTSRRLERLEATHVPLKGLAQGDAAAFVAQEWTKLFASTDPTVDHDLLRTATGGNPHFIKLALSQLRKGVRLDRIVKFLKDASGEPFKFYDDLWNQLGDDERLILRAMPLFATPPSWGSLLETTGLSEERLEDSIGLLAEFLLVEPWDEMGVSDRCYHAHPLTINYGATRLDQEPALKDQLRERFIIHFLDMAERHGYRSWKDYHVLEREQKNIFSAMQHLADIRDWKGLVDIAIRIRHFVVRQDRSRFMPYNRLGEYFSQAVDLCQRGISAAAKAGDVKSECRLLMELGNIEMIHGNLEAARTHFTNCLQKSREIGFSSRETMALRRLGHIEARRSNDAGAEGYYTQSLEVAQRFDDHVGIGRAYRAFGDLSFRRSDMTTALSYYERSVSATKANDDSIGLPRVIRRLGNLYYQLGRMTTAAQHFRRAIDLYVAKYDISGTCYSFYGLGKILLDLERFGDALVCTVASLRILGCIHTDVWPTVTEQLQRLEEEQSGSNENGLEMYVPTIDKTMRLCLGQASRIRSHLGKEAFAAMVSSLIDKWSGARQNWLSLVSLIFEELAPLQESSS